MVLQNVVFPRKGICEETQLYYRKCQGTIEEENGQLVLAPESEVSLFTYFNGFSSDKWNLYTDITTVSLIVECEGEGEISLWSATLNGDIMKEEHFQTGTIENGRCELRFNCRQQSGIVYPVIKAKSKLTICRAYYESAVDRVHPVTIAIGICTFQREKFVQKTLETLRSHLIENVDSPLSGHMYVYVSDNGNTLPAAQLSDEHIHVMPNKNAGGAGGFGRCMLEAVKERKRYGITHMLLMDDDIVLEPESIVRTYSLLSAAKEEYADAMLGGGLLRLDIPYIQHANGELWEGGRIGFTKRGFDLRNQVNVIRNEEDLPMDYNGWWFCCIPLGRYFRGFPLPVFIHGDDIEYGLRFERKIMTLNGIGVWHDAFDNRKASSMEYYDMRNMLIACAIHYPQFSKMHMIKMICRHLVGQMLHYREEDQLLTMKGVEDYCKGTTFLKETDPEILHEQIMKMGYRMVDVSEDLAEFHIEIHKERPDSHRLYEEKGFSKKHLLSINGWLLPAKRGTLAIPMGRHPDYLYRYKQVLLYDPDTKKGFYVERKRKNLFRTIGRCFKMCRLINKEYPRVVEDFQKHGKELISKEFWSQYFGEDI